MNRKRLARFLTAMLVAALAVVVVPAIASAAPDGHTVTVQPAAAQYSDYALLKAQVSPAGLPGSVAFTVDGSTDGLVGTAVYKARTGIATQRYRVPLPAGEYSIVATFTSTDQLTVVQGTGTLTVTAEDARITYTSWGGKPLPSLMPIRANGSSAPFAVIRTITEVPDGTPGDLQWGVENGQSMSQVGIGIDPFTPPTCSSASPALRETIVEARDGMPTGVAVFQMEISGYYAAYAGGAFAVYDPRSATSAGAAVLTHPVTGAHVVVAFFVAPQGDEPDGAFAFGHQLPMQQHLMTMAGPASAYLPVGLNGAQITYGPAQVTATDKDCRVRGSKDTIGVTFTDDYEESLSFAPVVVRQGAIDLR